MSRLLAVTTKMIAETKQTKKIIASLIVLFFAVQLSACANIVRPNFTQEITELRSGAYTLDPEHAYVHFKVDHLGLSKIVGRFNSVSATLDFDANKVTALALQGIIESASIDVNNNDLEDTLTDSAWFDAATHPQIIFESQTTQQEDSGDLVITGDLTVRGVTKPIQLRARFNGGADNILTGKYTLGFTATTELLRSDFGMDSFAALVGDRVEIELHGEFQRN